jgi:membrane protease YdiL (CAAX protease family)
VEDPRDINKMQFVLYTIVVIVISSMLTYVFYWTDDLLSIMGVSFLSSTILNSFGFLLQVSNTKIVASIAKSDSYKRSCQSV